MILLKFHNNSNKTIKFIYIDSLASQETASKLCIFICLFCNQMSFQDQPPSELLLFKRTQWKINKERIPELIRFQEQTNQRKTFDITS